MTDSPPVVAVTMGDPAGVGPEVVVRAASDFDERASVVVVGDLDALRDAAAFAGVDCPMRAVETPGDATPADDSLAVLDLDDVDVDALDHGVVREAYGRASLAYVERAVELARAGAVDAIATAPINKQSIRLAGCEHAGHTGLLAEATGTEEYAMLLVEGALRVSHVSTHVPLRVACDRVTTRRVFETIRLTDGGLRDLGVADPRVAVAGLNPHASDGGLLGDEEASEIRPAVERAREAGIDAFGPESPDTVFARAAGGEADAVVAMYHDQGHVPVKMLGFRGGDAVSGVNATLGLPFVRTSVDHGTAFDIAGEGRASAESLVDAVNLAVRFCDGRS